MCRLPVLFGYFVIFLKEVEFVSLTGSFGATTHIVSISVRLLKSLIDFDWWHQLPLGQKCVNLLHELEGGVLLVKDQSINIIDDDWDLPSLEKELELLPVILLFWIIFSVIKTMHLNLGWEVSWEDLCDEETVVKCSSDVLDWVRKIKRLKPLQDFSWKTSRSAIWVD